MKIILETDRLLLRVPAEGDYQNLLTLRSDPYVMKYLGSGAIQTPECNVSA
jgi:RimJ/RimL family protein N-acetyltransferase